MKPTLPQLRKKVDAAIAHENIFIASASADKNPQVEDMVLKAQGRVEALEALQWAFSGNMALLNIMTGE